MANTTTSEISGAGEPKATTMADNVAACDSCRRFGWTCIGGPICEKCALWGFDCMFTAGDAITDLRRAFGKLLLPGSPIPSPSNLSEADSNHNGGANSLSNGRASESSFLQETSTGDSTLETLDHDESATHQQLRKCRCPRCSRRYVFAEPGDDKTRLCPRCRTRKCKTSYRPPTETSESRVRAFAEERRRARHANACDSCRSSDFKCNEVQPCYMCRTNGTECTYKATRSIPIHSSPPLRPSNPATQRRLELQLRFPREPLPWDSLPLPPYHSSAPPLAYESLLGPPIAYAYSHVPTTQAPTPYTSIPSGCTTCFESKTRCARPCGFPCSRCVEKSLQCQPFPAGTRLAPCEACTRTKRLCTNVQKGLSCDGCVDVGVECSRLKLIAVGSVKQELETQKRAEVEDEAEDEKDEKDEEAQQQEVINRAILSRTRSTSQGATERQKLGPNSVEDSRIPVAHAPTGPEQLTEMEQERRPQPLGEQEHPDPHRDHADQDWCMITHEEARPLE